MGPWSIRPKKKYASTPSTTYSYGNADVCCAVCGDVTEFAAAGRLIERPSANPVGANLPGEPRILLAQLTSQSIVGPVKQPNGRTSLLCARLSVTAQHTSENTPLPGTRAAPGSKGLRRILRRSVMPGARQGPGKSLFRLADAGRSGGDLFTLAVDGLDSVCNGVGVDFFQGDMA